MNSKRQIVNIINFVRGVEPREYCDLLGTTKKQIELMQQHGLKGTFLLQYDALIQPEYVELMRSLDPEQFELGVWHEVVQPMTEKLGIRWTGRFPWDWHVHCGFPLGYTKEQRERLATELFEEFRRAFGSYPRVFGSWLFDTHTVRYLSDRYGLDALCNCKEQYGTDGYTLWGGYYGQGYYPSRTNAFMPAQTKEAQLPVPLFRMLGSDPVDQYDLGLDPVTGAKKVQGVVTLEPVYTGKTGGGGVKEWVDWYLKENYNGECLTFGYAQAGQENSFGWEAMEGGLCYQFELFERMQREGRIQVEKLGETGRWFKETYAVTPASTITAHTAYGDEDRSSVWYDSRFYRANLYVDHGALRIRDLHVFDEQMPDEYEDKACPGNEAVYETLPVADGNRHSGGGVIGGLYVLAPDGRPIACDEMRFEDLGNGCAQVDYGAVKVRLEEQKLSLSAEGAFKLESRIAPGADHVPEVLEQDSRRLRLRYSGTDYSVTLLKGRFEDVQTILSEDGAIEAQFN